MGDINIKHRASRSTIGPEEFRENTSSKYYTKISVQSNNFEDPARATIDDQRKSLSEESDLGDSESSTGSSDSEFNDLRRSNSESSRGEKEENAKGVEVLGFVDGDAAGGFLKRNRSTGIFGEGKQRETNEHNQLRVLEPNERSRDGSEPSSRSRETDESESEDERKIGEIEGDNLNIQQGLSRVEEGGESLSQLSERTEDDEEIIIPKRNEREAETVDFETRKPTKKVKKKKKAKVKGKKKKPKKKKKKGSKNENSGNLIKKKKTGGNKSRVSRFIKGSISKRNLKKKDS